MEYKFHSDPDEIRRLFMGQFVESYEVFSVYHNEWITRLPVEFNQENYDRMFMWERIIKNAHQIRFVDALATLKNKSRDVLFLTESSQCPIREFCRLNNRNEFVAVARAKDLAERISYEWYTEYELFEQGRYLAAPILPSELYIFDESYSWCLIFTHETDETESADSRFCLLIDKNAPRSKNG